METPKDIAGGHFRDVSDNWVISLDQDPTHVAAAWVQFRLAQIIWERVRGDHLDLKEFAGRLGQSVEAQRKKLSGEQAASLRDLLAWLMIAGADGYRVLPHDDSELFPPAARVLLGAWRSGGPSLPVFAPSARLEWPAFVDRLDTAMASASAQGRSHLLTTDWLRQQAIDWLTETGVAPAHIRLEVMSAIDCLQIGVVSRVTIAFELLRPAESEGPASALAAAWRVRDALRILAVQPGTGVLVIVSADALGGALLDEALPTSDAAQYIAFGPFELDDRSPADTSASAWWAHHQVVVRGLVRVNRDDGAAISVMPTEKIIDL